MRLLTAVSLVQVQQGELGREEKREKDPQTRVRRGGEGPMVKRLRHRPFTAVTRVRISLGSLWRHSQVVRRGSATP